MQNAMTRLLLHPRLLKRSDTNSAVYTRIDPFNIYKGSMFSKNIVISQETVSFDNIFQEFALYL